MLCTVKKSEEEEGTDNPDLLSDNIGWKINIYKIFLPFVSRANIILEK